MKVRNILGCALAIVLFGCANAVDQAVTTLPVETNAGLAPENTAEDGTNALGIPKDPAARMTIILWLLGAIVAVLGFFGTTQVWQLKQIYALNREVGVSTTWMKDALLRIASDSESEKHTRARVNALILKHIGIKDAVIDDILKEPPK